MPPITHKIALIAPVDGLTPFSLVASDVDKKLDSVTLSNGLSLDSGGILSLIASEIDHDQLLNVHQDVNTDASPIFAGATIGSLAGILKGTAGIVSGGATHADLASIDSNQHIDHTTVSVSPGTGMSGGGDISATRTLSCTITQYTDALARTAVIAASISDGDLTHSPDGNSVFDALALKAPLISPSFTTPTLGVALATSISIDGHVLNSTEFHYLDGQDQAVKTTSSPSFPAISIAKTVTGNSGGINLTTLTIDDTFGGTYATAGSFIAINSGNVGVSNNLTGLYCVGQQDGSGTISLMRGGSFNVYNTHATGIITTARVLDVNIPYFSSTGTIGTLYGLYIGAQAHANVTTPYAIYQAGASDRIYFAGKVGIGVNPAREKLDVTGNIITDWSNRFFGTWYSDGTAFRLGFDTNADARQTNIHAYSSSSAGIITFSTGTVSSPSERVRITNPGRIGVNIVAPLAQVHIDQSSTTGAIPVLTLDQADVSEEFIRFIGTAADNVITQSIVAAADVGVATIAGYVKVYVQDDGNQITDQAYYMPIYTLTAP